MTFSSTDVDIVIAAARALPINAPSVTVENFYVTTLGLTVFQQTAAFPSPDPSGKLAIAIAYLTKEREDRLSNKCEVPAFVVYEDSLKVFHIAGLETYLVANGVSLGIAGRFIHSGIIKTRLRALTRGHDLEAIGAAIMDAATDYGVATKGSGDQGIDALGWTELIKIDSAFINGTVHYGESSVGSKVFLLASSKATVGSASTTNTLISPAHIRELVGGWVIQRTSVGNWGNSQIRMLTPVQMILITTYRLSADAKNTCRELGVQVWSVPELIFLICVHAPSGVFGGVAPFTLNATAFRSWWKTFDAARLGVV